MRSIILPAQDAALTTDLLRRYQASWESLQKLAVNSKIDHILTGVEVSGTSVSAGYVVINGELLEFKAGTKADYVVVKELQTEITVSAGTYTEVDRWVEFGVGTGQLFFEDLRVRRVDDGVFTREYEITSWDMTTDSFRNLIIGGSNLGNVSGFKIEDVVSVSVLVRNDAEDVINPIYNDGSWSLKYEPTPSGHDHKIIITRGSSFDDAAYSGSGVRATVLVTFK